MSKSSLGRSTAQLATRWKRKGAGQGRVDRLGALRRTRKTPASLGIPKRAWLALCLLGLGVGLVIALVPVRVEFAGDPLLRLRDLDPELSPPAAAADCGRPRQASRVTAQGTSLFELARARACRDAGRRRLAVALATGGTMVALGLVGAASVARGGLMPHRPSTKPPAPVPSATEEGTVGKQRAAGSRRQGQQVLR